MNTKTFLLAVLTVFFTCAIAFAQVEEITLSTYYPAPYGEYEEMAAEKLFADKVIIGNMDVDGDGDFSDSDDIALMSVGSLLIENNVGIGTAWPAGQLQVMGSTAWDGAGRYYFTNNASLHGRNNLILTGRMDGSNDAWNFGTSARNSLVFNTNTSGVQGALGTEKYSIQLEGNSAALGFLSTTNGASPNMVLLQNGNVGIGTTGPQSYAALEVNTTGNKSIYTMDSANGGLLIGYQGSTIQARTTAHGNTQDLLLQRWGGNVGIGTTSPGAKLHVDGTPGVDGIMFPNGTLQVSAGKIIGSAYGATDQYMLIGTAGSFPADNTIPQITEGTAIPLSASYTPRFANSIINVEVLVNKGSGSDDSRAGVALFKNSESNAIAAAFAGDNVGLGEGYWDGPIFLRHQFVAGTTSSISFTVRMSAYEGSIRLNGRHGLATRLYGGALRSSIYITEITP